MSLVSIGMPAYNGEQCIRRALDSLLVQDYNNFELIISDNASTDATLQICKEYAGSDNHIRIHTHPHNVGSLANFKTVLEIASGKYFMWAACDDYWLPEFISTLIKELEKHPEAGVAMCAVERVYEDGTLFDTIRFKGNDDPNSRTHYQMMKSLTSPKKYNLYLYGLFKTHLLRQAILFYPEVPGLDRLFMCQMALATRFRYVDNVMYKKTLYVQPYNVRWPNEKFSKILNEDRFSDIKILLALGKMLFQSNIIPWYKKIYLPIALWRYGWLLLLSRFASKIKERVNPNIWNRLKKLKKLIFPS